MTFRKTAAALLALALCFAGSDSARASGIREVLRLAADGEPVRYEMTAEFGKLPQFDENRTEQLNLLMRHFTFAGILDNREATLQVALDGEELFSVSETEVGGIMTRTLISEEGSCIIPEEESAETGMMFSGVSAGISDNLEIYLFLEPYADFFESLPGLYPERCSSARITEKYRDYGTAVKKVSIRYTAEEWAECIRKHAPQVPEDICIPDPRKMVYDGRQDVELLMTEEGRLLKIRYGGRAGSSEEDLRTVRLEWKTVRNEDVEKDELTLRTPDSSSARRTNLVLEHLWRKAEDGSETFFWKAETDVLLQGVRTRGITVCTAETEDGNICGKYTETVTVKNRVTENSIAYSFSGSPEGQYTGILEIIGKNDKIENGRLKVNFRLTKEIAAQAGDAVPEAAAVRAEEYSDIRKKLVSGILHRIISLPPGDLLFLTEGIPEESLRTILPRQ